MSLVLKPKATIVAPTTVQINTQVILDGSQSTGNISKFKWVRKSGLKINIKDSGKAIANFTPDKAGIAKIKLKVDDSNGQIDRAFITINVLAGPPPNTPPTVSAGNDITVKENVLVKIDGSASDLDGEIVNVKWVQKLGEPVAVTADETDPTNFSFTTPTIQDGTSMVLEFELTAIDDEGASAKDSCQITVVKDIPTCPAGQQWDPATQSCVPIPTDEFVYTSKLWTFGGPAVTLPKGNKNWIILETGEAAGWLAPFDPQIALSHAGTQGPAVWDGTGKFNIKGDQSRDYLLVKNYNAVLYCTLIPHFASSSDDFSAKNSSRHNQGGAPANRPGGYGISFGPQEWDSKREDYHNVHTQLGSGRYSQPLRNDVAYPLRITCNRENGKVHMTGEINWGNGYVKEISAVDNKPLASFMNPAKFLEASYLWLRNNGKGSIDIRDVKVKLLPN